MRGAGSGAGRASEEKLIFFFPLLVVVNPSAFHNKSQIINKYIPLMTRLFNSRNWKMLRRFFFISPSPCCLVTAVQVGGPVAGTGPSAREDAETALRNPHPGGTSAAQPPVPPREPQPRARAFPSSRGSSVSAAWGSGSERLQGAGLWPEDHAGGGAVAASSRRGRGAGAGGDSCLASCSDLPVPFPSTSPWPGWAGCHSVTSPGTSPWQGWVPQGQQPKQEQGGWGCSQRC